MTLDSRWVMKTNRFSRWTHWKDRNALEGLEFPGVYALAISKRDLSGKRFSWIWERLLSSPCWECKNDGIPRQARNDGLCNVGGIAEAGGAGWGEWGRWDGWAARPPESPPREGTRPTTAGTAKKRLETFGRSRCAVRRPSHNADGRRVGVAAYNGDRCSSFDIFSLDIVFR